MAWKLPKLCKHKYESWVPASKASSVCSEAQGRHKSWRQQREVEESKRSRKPLCGRFKPFTAICFCSMFFYSVSIAAPEISVHCGHSCPWWELSAASLYPEIEMQLLNSLTLDKSHESLHTCVCHIPDLFQDNLLALSWGWGRCWFRSTLWSYSCNSKHCASCLWYFQLLQLWFWKV